jgi:hypothetical protein
LIIMIFSLFLSWPQPTDLVVMKSNDHKSNRQKLWIPRNNRHSYHRTCGWNATNQRINLVWFCFGWWIVISSMIWAGGMSSDAIGPIGRSDGENASNQSFAPKAVFLSEWHGFLWLPIGRDQNSCVGIDKTLWSRRYDFSWIYRDDRKLFVSAQTDRHINLGNKVLSVGTEFDSVNATRVNVKDVSIDR